MNRNVCMSVSKDCIFDIAVRLWRGWQADTVSMSTAAAMFYSSLHNVHIRTALCIQLQQQQISSAECRVLPLTLRAQLFPRLIIAGD